MAGMVLRLLPRTDFILSPSWAANTNWTIPLVQNVDISGWREVTLIVRVHTANAVVPAGGAINFQIKTVAPTEEDPATFFRGSTIATCAITNAMTPGTLLQQGGAANSGGLVSLFLNLAIAANGGTASCTVSVDLSLKD